MSFSTLLRSLSGFFLILLIGKISFAQTTLPVLYETALALPWSFVEQSLQTQMSADSTLEQFQMADIVVQAQGIPVTIQAPKLQMQMVLKPVIANQNETTLESSQLSLTVSIAGLQVQKDIVQNIGGIEAIVHVSAQCSAFTLAQPNAHVLTNWSWQASGLNLSAQILNLSLDWPANSWQVSGLSCQGPQGFADLVQADLQTELAQGETFAPMLKTVLQNALNSKIQTWLNKWQSSQWIPQSSTVSTTATVPQGLNLLLSGIKTVSSNGLLFQGVVSLGAQTDLSGVVNSGAAVIPLNTTDALLAQITSTATLIFSTQSLTMAVSQVSLWPKVDILLNSVSGFESLLKNWFFEIFIWPDLLNYSSASPFHLISQLSAPAQFQFSSGTNLGASFQAPVQSLMTASRDNQVWNYILFQSQVSAQTSIAIASGQLNLKFTNEKLQTKTKFGIDYIKKYAPSKYIAVGLIESALKSNTALSSASLALPKYQLSTVLTLEATAISRPTTDIFFIELGSNSGL